MALLKQIAGHTSCVPVHRYLERKMRAIAKELYNFEGWDERDCAGRDPAERDAVRWGAEMDFIRRACGNDTPWHGSPARTYKHFVISPSPSDNVSLEDLKALARDWALAHYADHQIAIVCHDDNENRIPHAHVVVNNTNLSTGRRMHDDDALKLNRDLQRMARERGLSAFGVDKEPDGAYARLAQRRGETEVRGRTSQRRMRSRAEAELVRKGQYSWVADIRDRVVIARSLAHSSQEFASVLAALGVTVSESSRKGASADWVFSLANHPTRRVCGGKLGASFSRAALERSLPRRSVAFSGEARSRELMSRASSAIELRDLRGLHELADAMDTACKYRLDSTDACDKAMARLCARATAAPTPHERKRLDAQIAQIDTAKRTLARLGILPDASPRSRKATGGDMRSTGWAASTRRDAHAQTSKDQQRHADERAGR
ncbi:relaxase/mobilization nuclease domain-containing protein [Adlercreutzia sp. ZJ141]|uniref:relaxase/mobilization nuclease domain-containing protein n=1 Tax=Adlercreutzia sp. ZJ141 TaxID=2709406 RepID=UPI0013EA3DEB|nr:relaxase/mobilization nuclease domain-containing protein [Adlercreutzia sp. ZJ141]